MKNVKPEQLKRAILVTREEYQKIVFGAFPNIVFYGYAFKTNSFVYDTDDDKVVTDAMVCDALSKHFDVKVTSHHPDGHNDRDIWIIYTSKFKVRLNCFDYDNDEPYEDTPIDDPIFDTYEDAYSYASSLAEFEAADLNADCEKFTSFGVVHDEDKKEIRMNCYMMADEYDTTGETRPVTIYKVITVDEN